MQGMGGENVKYLIDGVPIVGRVNGDIDLSQINMEPGFQVLLVLEYL